MAEEAVTQEEIPTQEEVPAQEDPAPADASTEATEDAAPEEPLPINPDHPEIARKMFVGGISNEVTDEEFKSHFAQYGVVADHVIIRKDKDKEQKEGSKKDSLYGFITFCDADNIDECFKKRPHVLKGKTMDVHHAVPKNDSVPNAKHKTKKLFVANIPKILNKEEYPDTTLKDELEKFMKAKFPNEEYGKIEKVQLVMKKDEQGNATDECKGFGFIEVSSEDFADKISLMLQFFEFCGRKCEIKKSDPKSSGGPGGGRPNMGRGGYQQYQQGYGQGGYGYDAYSGYGGGYYGGGYYGGGYPPYGAYPPYGGYGPGPYHRGRGQRYRPY